MTFEEIKQKTIELNGSFNWGEEDISLPPELEAKLPAAVPGSTHYIEDSEARRVLKETYQRKLFFEWKKQLSPLADKLAKDYYLAYKEEIDAEMAEIREKAAKSKAETLSGWYEEAARYGTYSGD